VSQVVHWQATVLALLPVVVGIPLGLAFGSAAFRWFVDRVGAVPDPDLSPRLLAVAVASLVVVANLAAALPARRARAVAAARLLSED
jgi:predicted lysophospholipase L1 biosynthesis ABC-type transport system permease subunit